MSRAGYVLVGGRSTRMGRDKAKMQFGAGVLAQHVAARVAEAAGTATLIGDPARYGDLGYPVIADLRPGLGPLGGIHTALRHTGADWNLVAACDLPGLTAPFLEELLEAAGKSVAGAVVPVGPDGEPEPVCAVWNRSALAHIESALDSGTRAVWQALQGLTVIWLPMAAHLSNVNTPDDWSGYVAR